MYKPLLSDHKLKQWMQHVFQCLLLELTEVQGSLFCLRQPLERLQNSSWISAQILLSAGKVFSVATWARVQRLNALPRAGVQRNGTFCIEMQILHRNGAFLSLSRGSGGWKKELCVPQAAGPGVSAQCLCVGLCKALNVPFFLLQLFQTPISSIDFTQSSACPWRCDLYLGLIYFCHGCSIFERAAGVGGGTMNSTWNINPEAAALRHSSTQPILPPGILHGLGLKRGKEKKKKEK